MKKIVYAILICIIIAGIVVIATVGLKADIIYSKNVELDVYVGETFERKDIEKKIAQKDNIYQGMYEDLKTGIIDYDEYKIFKENFKSEKNSLSSRLEIIDKQVNEYDKAEDNLKEVGKLYEKYSSIKEVTREILNEFVERIYIGKYNKETDSRDISIKWRYQF